MKSIKFGKKLKELREAANDTQLELAQYLGMTDRQIQRYESGQVPRHDKLLALSTLYKFNFQKFISEEPAPAEHILNDDGVPYSSLLDKTVSSFQQTISTLQDMVAQQKLWLAEKDALIAEKNEVIKELEAKLGKTGGRRSA